MKRFLVMGAAVALVFAGAPAAHGADLPTVRFHIKSVVYIVQAHAVEVSARVKCTGDGRMTWNASIQQGGVAASNEQKVRCDGVVRFTSLNLIASSGQLHAGKATFRDGYSVCTDIICNSFSQVREVHLTPDCPSCGR